MTNMFSTAYTAGTKKGYDAGLRQYMLKVYNYMAVALALSGVFAYAFMTFYPLTSLIFSITPGGAITGFTGLGYLVAFAPLGIAIYFFMGAGSMNVQTAQTLFWVYAALTGISLSSLGFIYTGASIAKTFFLTASLFGAMSIYGYTTDRDLTSLGSFLIIGLIGIILATVVNLFMQSSAIQFAVSILGILIFLGLTAYDTQKLKQIYYRAGNSDIAQRMAVVGAFSLYLDFINLFLYLIRFAGVRKD